MFRLRVICLQVPLCDSDDHSQRSIVVMPSHESVDHSVYRERSAQEFQYSFIRRLELLQVLRFPLGFEGIGLGS